MGKVSLQPCQWSVVAMSAIGRALFQYVGLDAANEVRLRRFDNG